MFLSPHSLFCVLAYGLKPFSRDQNEQFVSAWLCTRCCQEDYSLFFQLTSGTPLLGITWTWGELLASTKGCWMLTPCLKIIKHVLDHCIQSVIGWNCRASSLKDCTDGDIEVDSEELILYIIQYKINTLLFAPVLSHCLGSHGSHCSMYINN